MDGRDIDAVRTELGPHEHLPNKVQNSQNESSEDDSLRTTEPNPDKPVCEEVQDDQDEWTKMQKDDECEDVTINWDSGNESGTDEDTVGGLSSRLDWPVFEKEGLRGDEDDFPYEVLSTEQIVKYMIDCINEVNTVVQIPPTFTRILLNYFKWDKEKLYERYYDGDQEALFKEANIVNPAEMAPEGKVVNEKFCCSGLKSKEECEICFTEMLSTTKTGLSCGHRFCTDCWREYLSTKILDEGIGQAIPCAASGCDILVDDQTVMNAITDPKVKLKYQHLITNSFVECNRQIRWCPRPGCSNAIKVLYPDVQQVKCNCGHTFCFLCGENWHYPVQCELLKRWQKCADDKATKDWLAVNTKECPKCRTRIEKDGGCNHMVCSNQKCRTEFCWGCLVRWRFHSCDELDVMRNSSKLRAFAERQSRYFIYCSRHMKHKLSLKSESDKLYLEVQKKMAEMQQHMSWIEVQFLKKAVDVLCQCRQTLMYSYVLAFFLEKTNQSVILEENLKVLENATETLSEYLERDISPEEDVFDVKQKVQDKCRFCERQRRMLLEHVQEGYEKDWWEYRE